MKFWFVIKFDFSSKTGILVVKLAFATANLKIETLGMRRRFARVLVEGTQNSLFPEGPVIKCFVIPPDSKIEKAPKKSICLRPLRTLAALAKLSGYQNQPVLPKSHDNSPFLRS